MHYLDENCIGQAHKIPRNAMVMGFQTELVDFLNTSSIVISLKRFAKIRYSGLGICEQQLIFLKGVSIKTIYRSVPMYLYNLTNR